MGVFLVLLGLISLFGFGLDVADRGEGHLPACRARRRSSVSPLTMPVQGGVHRAGRGVRCCSAGGWSPPPPRRGSYAIFGVGVVVFTWSFLVWAARGGQLDFVQLLAGTLVSATPLVYGALSGVMCERSGVVNIAIEGQFLAGAFLGAMIASASHNLWLGRARRRGVRGAVRCAAGVPYAALRRRPDHRRRGHRRLLHRADQLPHRPGAHAGPGHAQQPEHVRLDRACPGCRRSRSSVRCCSTRTSSCTALRSCSSSSTSRCSTPAGGCGCARSASIRGRPPPSASTSSRCATAT